jgi:hypothetical protein
LNWIRLLFIILLLVFISAFHAEIGMALWVTVENLRWLVGTPTALRSFPPEVFLAIRILRINFLAFLLTACLMVWLVAAPAILPLTDLAGIFENYFRPPNDPDYAGRNGLTRFFWRLGVGIQNLFDDLPNFLSQIAQYLSQRFFAGVYLWLSIFGLVGQVVFVRNGTVLETSQDTNRRGLPGVVVIDFNSAVILELQHPPPNLVGFLLNLVTFLILALLRLIGIEAWTQNQRILGAGLYFTIPLERIRSSVDLRRQTRSQMNVHAYTRDGIEVETIVWTIFTLGIDPELFGSQVTYVGGRQAQNLKVINLTDLPDGKVRVQYDRASDFRLDAADRTEIVNSLIPPQPYSPMPNPRALRPPSFNPGRVFAALSSQPLAFQPGSAQSGLLPWQDISQRISSDVFREMISQVNFDDLYQPENQPRLPVPVLRQRFAARMQSNGIRSYRLVQHRRGKSLEDGVEYQARDLLVSEIRPLTNSRTLRERGILVIASGFTELLAVNKQIYDQRLENWSVRWETDTNIQRASEERQAMRARAMARVQTQTDLFNAFSKIYSDQNQTQEVMAIRLLQAMEGITADPTVKNLVPAEVINLLRNLDSMLNPEEKKTKGQTISAVAVEQSYMQPPAPPETHEPPHEEEEP